MFKLQGGLKVVSKDNSILIGWRLKLYRTLIPTLRVPKEWDFLLWGSANFLCIEKFNSLSQFSLIANESITKRDSNDSLTPENRYLYIYKTETVEPGFSEEVAAIFKKNHEFPLLTITLLKSDSVDIKKSLQKASYINNIRYELFQTLGHDTDVLIIRSKTYIHVLDLLVQLNTTCNNTYSISGVEEPFKQQEDNKKDLLYYSVLQPDSQVQIIYDCAVVKYILKDGNKIGNRVQDVIDKLEKLWDEFLEKHSLSCSDLKKSIYYEIGRFDIELRIEGQVAYILELLINPEYGLANIQSNFYTKHIIESRTTWKSLAPMVKHDRN